MQSGTGLRPEGDVVLGRYHPTKPLWWRWSVTARVGCWHRVLSSPSAPLQRRPISRNKRSFENLNFVILTVADILIHLAQCFDPPRHGNLFLPRTLDARRARRPKHLFHLVFDTLVLAVPSNRVAGDVMHCAEVNGVPPGALAGPKEFLNAREAEFVVLVEGE